MYCLHIHIPMRSAYIIPLCGRSTYINSWPADNNGVYGESSYTVHIAVGKRLRDSLLSWKKAHYKHNIINLTNIKYSCIPVRLMLYSELGSPVSVLSHVSALTVTPYSGLMVLFTVILCCLSLPDRVYTALPSMTTQFGDDGSHKWVDSQTTHTETQSQHN